MIEPEIDPYVAWIAREARRPVARDTVAVARLMAAVRAEPRPVRQPSVWRWLTEPRSFALSPAIGAALAAGLVGIGALVGVLNMNRGDSRGVGRPSGVAEILPPSFDSSAARVIKFVLVAPHAQTVSVVGDFNMWDAKATPMTRTPTGGTWSVSVPLGSGGHVYAFVVNGSNGVEWVADPSAPLAPEDGLGAPNSVVLVGGASS